MHLLWAELRAAVPLIVDGDPYLYAVIGFTLQVAAIATGIAALTGLPLGLAIALGRFRGRGVLHALANASLGLPPVIVGLVLFLVLVPQGPLGGLNLTATRRAVFIAQAILALPYVVALTAAAVQGLPPGLLHQARALRAGRVQLASLAMREARVGMITAIIAALGTALSEVAAIAIVGGNVYGYDQTLASASLYYANTGRYDYAVAVGIVLLVLIVVLMGGVSLLQHSDGGIRMRFRAAR